MPSLNLAVFLFERGPHLIALRQEESGVLVMELANHLWPDDFEIAIPVLHNAAQSRQNPLLLLVEVAADFDATPETVLRQILQPGILVHNRLCRVAVLTTRIAAWENDLLLERLTKVEIRSFGLEQRAEARAWLLSPARPQSMPPILG